MFFVVFMIDFSAVYLTRMFLSILQMQLEKYGYLNCKVGRMRRSTQNLTEHHTYHVKEGNGRSCSDDEIKSAIKEYQKKYKLPETGIVDETTRKFMSTSRCGNSDSDDNPDLEPLDSLANYENNRVYNKDSLPLPKNELTNKRRWRRTAHHSVLFKLIKVDKSRKHSARRRQSFLRSHIKKLKNEDPLWLQPERHKRSIIVHINETGANGGKIRDGKKFTKLDIRWRLLQTGFSTRIPVEEQRASLNMAFRMWSEVIPLKFEEDVSGDIKAVDIEVAFGRGEILQISYYNILAES